MSSRRTFSLFDSIKYKSEPPNDDMKLSNVRDLYRFLWNENKEEGPRVYRFAAMLMGATDSPYQAAAVVSKHLDEIIATSSDMEEVETAKEVKKRLYIDELLLSISSKNSGANLKI